VLQAKQGGPDHISKNGYRLGSWVKLTCSRTTKEDKRGTIKAVIFPEDLARVKFIETNDTNQIEGSNSFQNVLKIEILEIKTVRSYVDLRSKTEVLMKTAAAYEKLWPCRRFSTKKTTTRV